MHNNIYYEHNIYEHSMKYNNNNNNNNNNTFATVTDSFQIQYFIKKRVKIHMITTTAKLVTTNNSKIDMLNFILSFLQICHIAKCLYLQ